MDPETQPKVENEASGEVKMSPQAGDASPSGDAEAKNGNHHEGDSHDNKGGKKGKYERRSQGNIKISRRRSRAGDYKDKNVEDSAENGDQRGRPSKYQRRINQAKARQAKKALWISIVQTDDEHRMFTEDHEKALTAALNEAVAKYVRSGGKPKMEGIKTMNGYYTVRCADQDTQTWLTQLIDSGEVKPWDGAVLKAVNFTEHKKLIRAKIWVKELTLDAPEILKILQSQNGVNTEKWDVISASKKEHGCLLSLCIDSESVEAIKKEQNSLWFLCDQVKVKIFSDS